MRVLLHVILLLACTALTPVVPQYEPLVQDFNTARKHTQKPIIFFITPTHQEYTQIADLTRMSQFLQVATKVEGHNVYWLVVEDSPDHCSARIRHLLDRSGLAYGHVHQASAKVSSSARFGLKMNKGINQRNFALDIIENRYIDNSQLSRNAVIYFADGDNTYDTRLVDELVKTRGVSVFPVGFTAGLLYERCLVDEKTGLVAGFVGWRGGRKFPIDMAGFSISLQVILDKRPRFRQTTRMGKLESNFISMMITDKVELKPLASNCTQVLVWHTKTTSRIPDDVVNPNPGDAKKLYELLKAEI